MNFEDERYVKVYTRKTVTTKLLGWEGRLCLWALLVEVDRAGVLDLDGMDPADALAAVADIPIEHCRVGMARILERGVAVVTNGSLLVPNFLEAQDAKQSDRQRQRESRGRRAAEFRSSEFAAREASTVTKRDHIESQNVTDCHTLSRLVTPAQLSSAQLNPPVVPPSEGPTPKTTRKRRQTSGTPAPESLEPNAATLRCAQEMGLDPVREIAACLDFHRGKGSIQVDWQATARTWFRKASDFAGQRRPPGMAVHLETRQTPAHRPIKLMPSKHDGQVTAAEFAEMARKIGRPGL